MSLTHLFRLALVYGTSITTSLAMLWIQPSRFAATAATQFITSFSGGSVIDSYTHARGFKFTVGGSGITVTEVGIYGNSSHYASSMTVYLRASDGTDLGNASITWGTGSQWYWATLSSPVSLSASTTYYLVTASVNYNHIHYNVAVTPTSVATVDDGAEDQPPFGSSTGSNTSQAAINFKYH